MEVLKDLFLTSALDRVEWSTPVALLLGKSPGTHCRGGCVGSRAGLGGNGEVKNLLPLEFEDPDRPVHRKLLH